MNKKNSFLKILDLDIKKPSDASQTYILCWSESEG